MDSSMLSPKTMGEQIPHKGESTLPNEPSCERTSCTGSTTTSVFELRSWLAKVGDTHREQCHKNRILTKRMPSVTEPPLLTKKRQNDREAQWTSMFSSVTTSSSTSTSPTNAVKIERSTHKNTESLKQDGLSLYTAPQVSPNHSFSGKDTAEPVFVSTRVLSPLPMSSLEDQHRRCIKDSKPTFRSFEFVEVITFPERPQFTMDVEIPTLTSSNDPPDFTCFSADKCNADYEIIDIAPFVPQPRPILDMDTPLLSVFESSPSILSSAPLTASCLNSHKKNPKQHHVAFSDMHEIMSRRFPICRKSRDEYAASDVGPVPKPTLSISRGGGHLPMSQHDVPKIPRDSKYNEKNANHRPHYDGTSCMTGLQTDPGEDYDSRIRRISHRLVRQMKECPMPVVQNIDSSAQHLRLRRTLLRCKSMKHSVQEQADQSCLLTRPSPPIREASTETHQVETSVSIEMVQSVTVLAARQEAKFLSPPSSTAQARKPLKHSEQMSRATLFQDRFPRSCSLDTHRAEKHAQTTYPRSSPSVGEGDAMKSTTPRSVESVRLYVVPGPIDAKRGRENLLESHREHTLASTHTDFLTYPPLLHSKASTRLPRHRISKVLSPCRPGRVAIDEPDPKTYSTKSSPSYPPIVQRSTFNSSKCIENLFAPSPLPVNESSHHYTRTVNKETLRDSQNRAVRVLDQINFSTRSGASTKAICPLGSAVSKSPSSTATLDNLRKVPSKLASSIHVKNAVRQFGTQEQQTLLQLRKQELVKKFVTNRETTHMKVRWQVDPHTGVYKKHVMMEELDKQSL